MKKVLSIMLITLLVICSLQIDLVTLYTKAETVNKIYTVLDLWCVRNDLTANYILTAAPTSAIISFKAASSSSLLICLGR